MLRFPRVFFAQPALKSDRSTKIQDPPPELLQIDPMI